MTVSKMRRIKSECATSLSGRRARNSLKLRATPELCIVFVVKMPAHCDSKMIKSTQFQPSSKYALGDIIKPSATVRKKNSNAKATPVIISITKNAGLLYSDAVMIAFSAGSG